MKKLLALIVLGLLLSENAFAQSMISISKYIQKNSQNSKDPIAQVYISKRCSAVYLYMFTLTEVRDPKTAENYVKAYEDLFFSAAKILVKFGNLDLETASNEVSKDLDNMMKYYIKDGEDYFIRTGTHVMDNYIGDDLRFCKKVMDSRK
jgi:hypothetical protein